MIKLFRSIIFVLIVCGLVASSWAKTEKQVEEPLRVACESIFKSFVFNVMLEKELCHYDGGVAEKLAGVYLKMKCDNVLLTEQSKDELAEIVIEDTLKRYHAYGEDTFCEANMQQYVDAKFLLSDDVE